MEVDVQCGVVAFAEGGFHRLVVQVGCPRVVDGVGVGLRSEGDVEGGVGCIEDVGLVGDEAGELRGVILPCLVRGGDDVDVGVDKDFLGVIGLSCDQIWHLSGDAGFLVEG